MAVQTGMWDMACEFMGCLGRVTIIFDLSQNLTNHKQAIHTRSKRQNVQSKKSDVKLLCMDKMQLMAK